VAQELGNGEERGTGSKDMRLYRSGTVVLKVVNDV